MNECIRFAGTWAFTVRRTRHAPLMTTRTIFFTGGSTGPWRVVEQRTIAGAPIPDVQRLSMLSSDSVLGVTDRVWILRGISSHLRYTSRNELKTLQSMQAPLGRPESRCAALIPIRKNAAWWALAQDERLDIVRNHSRHIEDGKRYLPAIARSLFHCRDLNDGLPFDFLTWFEFRPADSSAFDELLAMLRATPEWTYIDREVELRLELDA